MTDARTFAELTAEWHLGDDSIGRNATRALTAAAITPAMAAAMTPREIAAIPGLGVARLKRVREQLGRLAAARAETTSDTAVGAPTIRRAAEAIREIANGVTTVSHDWTVHPPENGSEWTIGAGTVRVAETPDYGQWYLPDHIAAWTPPIALLVADLLDTIATEIDQALEDHDDRLPGPWPAAWRTALDLATTYLAKDPRR